MTIQSYIDSVHTPSFPHRSNPSRSELDALIAGQDDPNVDPDLTVSDVIQNAHYRRETWRFQTRPGLSAFGYYFVPKSLVGTKPTVLCLPGHGRGVDSIVGIDESGAMRPWGEWGEYQQDFALQCVAHGYPVLALEQLSFGYRKSEGCNDQSSCVQDSMRLLAYGQTMMGMRVWDARRALDLLGTQPEVDSAKLSVMGISGGGAVAFFAACVKPKVQLACISGYFNRFTDSILAIPHCPDNFIPGMAKLGEMSDLAKLIAPRSLAVESGTLDHIFPIAAFNSAVEEASRHWSDRTRFTHHAFEGEHVFNGEIFWPALEALDRGD